MTETFIIESARTKVKSSISQKYTCLEDELFDCEKCNFPSDFCPVHEEEFGCSEPVIGAHLDWKNGWDFYLAKNWNTTSSIKGEQKSLSKALLQNFGLQAILSHHVLKKEEVALLNLKRADYNLELPSFTTCTLTLPCVVASQASEDDRDHEQDLYRVYSSTSYLIDMASLRLEKKDRARFQHAMHVLGLKPFVHLYQMQHCLSARLEQPKYVDQGTTQDIMSRFESKALRKELQSLKKRKRALEQAKWPQLISIVSSKSVV
ncbi:MAG: hypothetical protein M1821_003901 [Bathelium mastoideum]|nr:MAG: hypothetical protein M1821_003901 [Bathelium mastoideum]